MTLQDYTLYVLVGALLGLVTYLWERRHWRHSYRSDLMLYVLLGACVGTAALIALVIAAPGILLLRAQDSWSRHIPDHVPGSFPWLKGVDQRERASAPRTR